MFNKREKMVKNDPSWTKAKKKKKKYFHYFGSSQYSQPNFKTGKGVLCCMCGVF